MILPCLRMPFLISSGDWACFSDQASFGVESSGCSRRPGFAAAAMGTAVGVATPSRAGRSWCRWQAAGAAVGWSTFPLLSLASQRSNRHHWNRKARVGRWRWPSAQMTTEPLSQHQRLRVALVEVQQQKTTVATPAATSSRCNRPALCSHCGHVPRRFVRIARV